MWEFSPRFRKLVAANTTTREKNRVKVRSRSVVFATATVAKQPLPSFRAKTALPARTFLFFIFLLFRERKKEKKNNQMEEAPHEGSVYPEEDLAQQCTAGLLLLRRERLDAIPESAPDRPLRSLRAQGRDRRGRSAAGGGLRRREPVHRLESTGSLLAVLHRRLYAWSLKPSAAVGTAAEGSGT